MEKSFPKKEIHHYSLTKEMELSQEINFNTLNFEKDQLGHLTFHDLSIITFVLIQFVNYSKTF